jgi:hypothetical protein
MTGLTMLWLPIVLSAVVVFIMSSILHMVLPWHKGDYASVPNQDAVMNVLRPFAIPPGDYMVPHPASREELRSPEFAEKMKSGPVMVLTVMPNGPYSMGRNLGMWFVYIVVVTIIAAYVGSRALGPGALYLQVFRFVGVTAFVGYALALWQMLIWYQRSTAVTVKSTIDGLIYALLTAGIFGWLWPR